MFWFIKNRPNLQGVVMERWGGVYHLFTTKAMHPEPERIWERTVHHAISSDLLRWENQPDVLGKGAEGAFDGFTLYDLHTIHDRGRSWLFYTGLDKPPPGQHQSIGLAISDDSRRWERHPANPILRCDPVFYEPSLPDEAIHQEKDRGRQWFRDPWVIRDPETGIFGMAVGARIRGGHPDTRGCVAWATSHDLLRWTPKAPIFAPGRFHTIECPCMFELDGHWHLVWLTHPGWGTPFTSTDPWQSAGGIFHAVSSSGLLGPYERPKEELVVGGSYATADGTRRMRTMVFRTVDGADGAIYGYYHLVTTPGFGDVVAPDDALGRTLASQYSVMPLPKPLVSMPDGGLGLGWSPLSEGMLDREVPLSMPLMPGWRGADGAWIGRHFTGRGALRMGELPDGGSIYAHIRFACGWRAGFELRSNGDGEGLEIVADRQRRCLTLARSCDGEEFIDRRSWSGKDEIELRVAFCGPSIEIYADGCLALHAVRYRERGTIWGLVTDHAEAQFDAISARPWQKGLRLTPE
jgi:beta-fructofuranosidase